MTNKTTSELRRYTGNPVEVPHLSLIISKYRLLRSLTVVVDGYPKFMDDKEFWECHDE